MQKVVPVKRKKMNQKQDAVADPKANEAALAKKKKLAQRTKISAGVFAFLFIIFIIWAATQPRYGTMYFGVCKVFIEQQLFFPDSMRVRDLRPIIGGSDVSFRMWVTYIGESGRYHYRSFECTFKGRDLELRRVTQELRPYDEELIEQFNLSLPAILAHPPNLELPPFMDGPLESLWHGNY